MILSQQAAGILKLAASYCQPPQTATIVQPPKR